MALLETVAGPMKFLAPLAAAAVTMMSANAVVGIARRCKGLSRAVPVGHPGLLLWGLPGQLLWGWQGLPLWGLPLLKLVDQIKALDLEHVPGALRDALHVSFQETGEVMHNLPVARESGGCGHGL